MIICESLTMELLNLKKKNAWTDGQLLQMIAKNSIYRREVSIFFDLQIQRGKAKPIDQMAPELVDEIRRFVRQFSLNKTEQMELGKACALIYQLNKP